MAWYKTARKLLKLLSHSRLFPWLSPLTFIPNFATFRQSPASIPRLNVLYCTSLSSGLDRPETDSCSLPSPFCELFRQKESLDVNLNEKWSTPSAWYIEHKCQFPKAFPHPYFRNVCATCQNVAKNGCARTFQIVFHSCLLPQGNELYVPEDLYRNERDGHSPPVTSSPWV